MSKVDQIEINEEERDLLAELIVSRYDDAVSARNSATGYKGKTVAHWLDESYDRYMGNACNHDFNLTRIKTGALHAKVKDMVINSVDAPFTIEPTPIPKLSSEQRDEVRLVLEDMLGIKLLEAGITIEDDEGNKWPDYEAVMQPGHIGKLVPSVAEWVDKAAREQAVQMGIEANRIAHQASAKALTLMYDQMLEGGWRDAYLDALFDIILRGTGVIREEERAVQSLKWSGDKLKPTTDVIMTWRHVPIQNFFPSADSESAQEGTYVIERSAMRKQDLKAATVIEWVSKEKVDEAFEQAQDNFSWLEDRDSEQGTGWRDDGLIDVLIHEGTVQGVKLLDWVNEDKLKDIDPGEFYDVECWVVANVAIGLRLTDHLKTTRSYYSANFQRAGRNFWGIGTAMSLSTVEDRLNRWMQDIDDDVDLNTGLPIFYDVEAFEDPKDIDLSGKFAKIPYSPEAPGATKARPFHQPQFSFKAHQIINVFNWLYRLADDESGVPGLLTGNDNLMGGESTFRGMKMLAATANTLIKDAFLNIDSTLIQPAMENLWRWNMINSDDPTIRADVKVVARGASGLMQREIADAERTDVLPILMQLVQSAGLAPEESTKIMRYLLSKTMEQGGLPVDELIQNPQATAELGGVISSLNPATPQPTIGADTNVGGLNVN